MGSGLRCGTFRGMFGVVPPVCSLAFVFWTFLLWKILTLHLDPEPLGDLMTPALQMIDVNDGTYIKMNSCTDSANEDSAPNSFQNHDMKQKMERLGYLMRFC